MPSPARGAARELARPISTQPENATAQPANTRRGERASPSRRPASTAMRIGPVLMSIAAVPASTRRSAADETL